MQPFNRFSPRRATEPPQTNRPDPSVVPGPSNRTFMPTPSGALLSRGVSIKGSVKFLNELLIDGEVEGTIDSTGTLTIGEHARIRGEIRTKSVKVRGTVEGNILVTGRGGVTSRRPGWWSMRTRHSLAAQRSGRGSYSRPDVLLPSRTQSATQSDT